MVARSQSRSRAPELPSQCGSEHPRPRGGRRAETPVELPSLSETQPRSDQVTLRDQQHGRGEHWTTTSWPSGQMHNFALFDRLCIELFLQSFLYVRIPGNIFFRIQMLTLWRSRKINWRYASLLGLGLSELHFKWILFRVPRISQTQRNWYPWTCLEKSSSFYFTISQDFQNLDLDFW